MTIVLGATGVKAVLLDIEGTTTPLSFVHDTLFPYALGHLRPFLHRRATGPDTMAALALLAAERAQEPLGSDAPEWVTVTPTATLDSAADYAEWLMARDSKSPGLKALQGQVWKVGYESGTLRGDVFDDVPRSLRAWRAVGVRTAIYSSGSALAQRLIFSTTQYGDLTLEIEAHFDTAVGPKRDRASYVAIAGTMRLEPTTILFLSDMVVELDAAVAAGCQVALIVRPGNAPQPARAGIPVIQSLDEIRP